MTLGYPGEHQTKQNRCGNANPLRLDSEMFGVCVCVKPFRTHFNPFKHQQPLNQPQPGISKEREVAGSSNGQ